MSRNHPIEVADVERALKALEFYPRPKKGSSHVQWVRDADSGRRDSLFRKVTVDAPKAPFSPDLVSSMAAQAGISVKQFRELCTPQSIKKAKKKKLKWLNVILARNKKLEEGPNE